MGFFDREVRNGFDAMFDWNRDGVINPCEQAAQFDYLEHLDSSSKDSYEDEEEEILDEIDGMDEDEAREYLESEGYDPDDFDF